MSPTPGPQRVRRRRATEQRARPYAAYARRVSFPTVRVAAIQATPVILDAEASVDKALGLLEQASKNGVQLAAFPEVFSPLDEWCAWADDAASIEGGDELWERLWDNSVDGPGPLTDRIAET